VDVVDGGCVAESAQRFAARFLGTRPVRDERFDSELDVVLDLVAHLGLDVRATA
jgi:hypothetical protein